MYLKRGFTLAEVLITLGVIGVVAALTLPTVINNGNKKALETQNKKAQTVLANGIKMLMAQEEVTSLKDTKLMQCTDSKCISEQLKRVFKMAGEITNTSENVVEKYKFTNGEFEIWQDSNMSYGFISPDGVKFGIKNSRLAQEY